MFTWWNLLSFVLGALFGSGAIWSFLNYRQRSKEIALTSATSIAGLQRDLTNKLLELMAKCDEYADVRDGKLSVDIPDNRLLQLKEHIEILRHDVVSCEARLAKLEDRSARNLKVDYMRPEPPRLRIVVEDNTDDTFTVRIIEQDDSNQPP
jgi:hypothetical protein